MWGPPFTTAGKALIVHLPPNHSYILLSTFWEEEQEEQDFTSWLWNLRRSTARGFRTRPKLRGVGSIQLSLHFSSMNSTNEPAFGKMAILSSKGTTFPTTTVGNCALEWLYLSSLARVQLILSLSAALFALFLSCALRGSKIPDTQNFIEWTPLGLHPLRSLFVARSWSTGTSRLYGMKTQISILRSFSSMSTK